MRWCKYPHKALLELPRDRLAQIETAILYGLPPALQGLCVWEISMYMQEAGHIL